jgi:ectoine hydroxylase-related dioxygenase (phytanoyl-CoA dioxygenase family)
MSYTLNYHIYHHFLPSRTYDIQATPEEVEFLAEQGYLIYERLFSEEQTEELRQALDWVAEQEGHTARSGQNWGGIFLRHLMEKHPAFLKLFRFEPGLSLARATLGPQVQVLPMTGRIAYPDADGQATPWHIHQRVLPKPLPPFFSMPHVLDCLIYLDDVDDASGPLCIVPGSHKRIHEEFPHATYHEDLPDQKVIRVPAGSCAVIHGNVFHRGLPTTPAGKTRRLLILPYAASWIQLPTFGERPKNGLMAPLYENPDQETRELLGIPEGLY